MDTNLMLRDGSTDLTGDETLTAVNIGPMVNPLYLHIDVPSVSSGDTLDVELEFLNSSSVEQVNSNIKQITALGKYVVPFFTNQPKLQVKLNETDNGGPNFGAVKVWISTSPIS